MNKIVVITGGSSGIGLNLKQRFEKDGCTCYALAINNPCNTSNYIECDVTNKEQVKSAIDYIGQKHGKIDILLNNAGYGLFGASELLEVEQIQKQMDTNFMGVAITTKYALKYMSEGGKIINTSSACALFPLPYRNFYSASKAAVSSYSVGLRMELKPLKIQVASICPGDIKTPFIQNKVKNFNTSERYKDRIKNASDYVDSHNDKRMEVDYACKKIYKIINKKKLKPEYIISKKYNFLHFILRFFPKSVYVNIVEKFFGGHK